MHRPHMAVIGLVVLSLWAPSGLALLEEGTSFEPSHEGADFPVGWTEFNLGGAFSPEVRMVYPAMFAGEGKDMAGNGPFPWLIFVGDSGEGLDDYDLWSDELVKRGFIVVITQAFSDETDVEETLDRFVDIQDAMAQQNQSNVHVLGSVGNIDVDHWGVSGHGKGAAAAYLSFPFWDQTAVAANVHPPRAVFGLGLDVEDLDASFEWDDVAVPAFPQPNTGLFITGTVDEIAPSQETMERVEGLGGLAWHWIHLLGADHYQFQDTRSIFESDEGATMSQTAQIGLSAEHVVAYLDTVLHGDHARFRDAFNRGEGPQTVSDPNAYVDENLDAASFLRWTATSASHNTSSPLNGTQNLTLSVNWTLRDGTSFEALPAGWDVNLTCGWSNGPWEGEGTVAANGTASCVYPMAPVAPGLQKAWLRLEVEGAPSTFGAVVLRDNTPIVPQSPKPVIYVPQHKDRTVEASSVGLDPDGQLVRIVEATLSGDDAFHFRVDVAQDGLNMTVSHALDEEWLGECLLDVTLRSDGETLDEYSTQLRVVMTPVNDPPVKEGTVPIQEMDEDGPSVVYDLGDVVTDPEGEALEVFLGGEKNGEQMPVRFSIEGERVTLTPLPNAHGATVLQMLVSDGENPSLMVELPVVVNPVDDPVVINASQWTNLSFPEDTTFSLPLDPLAYDVDGDELTWTLEGNIDSFQSSFVNGTLELTPKQDVFGVFEGVWLNVSDGTSAHAHNMTVTVEAMGDLPFVSIESVQGLSGSTANMYWSVVDVDQTVDTQANVTVDGVVVDVNHSCLNSGAGAFQCVTLLPVPADPSTSFFIELEIYDAGLDRSVIASKVVDPSVIGTDQNETSTSEDVEGTGSVVVIAGFGTALVLVGVVGFMVARSRKAAAQQASMPAPSEEAPAPRGTGLLARAEQLK